MIRYKISSPSGEATAQLDVDNTYTEARLELGGDLAVVAAFKRAVMHGAGLSIAALAAELGALRGGTLIEWMESDALRALSPVMLAGQDIARDGGTFARHDCSMAADLLGSKLGGLAALPRTDEVFRDGYQWSHLEQDIRYCARELAVWDTHCGAAHLPALLAAAERELRRLGSALDASAVLPAFRRVDLRADAETILRALWAKLDAPGVAGG